VRELVRVATDAGQRVELRDDGPPLPAPIARVVHRVVQEGLTNARKHAPGAAVTVTVSGEPDGTVEVTVDNSAAVGKGLDLPGTGTGLIGLAERVRLVSGTLHSGPYEHGWRLRAQVPWHERTSAELEEVR
jgi:signal transduction histidine kinase